MNEKRVSVRVRIGAVIMIALMLFMCAAVHSGTIAESERGSITVNMNDVERLGNKSNIILALYRVGQPDMNSSTGWAPTSEFVGVSQTDGFPPADNVGCSRLLGEVGNIIQRNHLRPYMTAKTGADGIARFTGLEYGVYYLCVYYSVSGINFSPCLLVVSPFMLDTSINAKYSYNTADTEGPYSLFVDYVYESTGEPAAETYSDTLDEGDNYSVKSPKVTGYTPTIKSLSGTMPSHSVVYSVLYSRSNDTTQDVGGTVTWVGDNPSERPNSVVIILLKDGETYSSEPTWEKNGDVWTYTFEDVPIYGDDGTTPAVYTVEAEDLHDYTKRQDGMDIVYSAGYSLPSSGSYGALMCYVIGAAIIIGSLVVFKNKRSVLFAIILTSLAAVNVFAPVSALAEANYGVVVFSGDAPSGIRGSLVLDLYRVGEPAESPSGFALYSEYSQFNALLSSNSTSASNAFKSLVRYIKQQHKTPDYGNITVPINDPTMPSASVTVREGVYVWIVADNPENAIIKDGVFMLPYNYDHWIVQVSFKIAMATPTPAPDPTPPGPPVPTPPVPTPPVPTPPVPTPPVPTPTPTPVAPQTMEFTFYKIDSRETEIGGPTTGHKILDGAEFELYYDSAGTRPVTLYLTPFGYSALDIGGDVPPALGEPEVIAPSTTIIEAGQARIYNLPQAQSYYLKEVAAPNGYQKTEGMIRVRLPQASSGIVQTVDGVDYLVSGGLAVENEYQITGEELPETGGEGTAYIYVIGALLLIIAIVWLNLRRQKQA